MHPPARRTATSPAITRRRQRSCTSSISSQLSRSRALFCLILNFRSDETALTFRDMCDQPNIRYASIRQKGPSWSQHQPIASASSEGGDEPLPPLYDMAASRQSSFERQSSFDALPPSPTVSPGSRSGTAGARGTAMPAPPLMFMMGDDGTVIKTEHVEDENGYLDLASGDLFIAATTKPDGGTQSMEQTAYTASFNGKDKDNCLRFLPMTTKGGAPVVQTTNSNPTCFTRIPVRFSWCVCVWWWWVGGTRQDLHLKWHWSTQRRPRRFAHSTHITRIQCVRTR